MRGRRGFTLVELLAVMAVGGTLVAISIPSAAGVRRNFAEDDGAQRLVLVLRAAQSRAQAHRTTVRVSVGDDGRYSVTELAGPGDTTTLRVARGSLGSPVAGNYPGGVVEFGPRGWPLAAGSLTPRAGTFRVGDSRRVVLQLAGCIRCL